MQQHRKQGSADTTQKASNMRCTHAHCREPQAVTTPSPPRSPTLAHIHRYVDVGWLNIMSLLSVEPKKRDSSIIFLPAKHTHLHTCTRTKVSELLCCGRFSHFNKWCHHKRKWSYHHSLLTSAGTPETHSCLLTWKILACFDKPDTTATHVGSTCKFTKSLRSSQIFIIFFLKPGL